jgi:hypothetical protein
MNKEMRAVIWIALVTLVLSMALTLYVRGQGMVGEVVPQSQTVLDSYFVSNAVPNQLQFWELIDSLFFYYNSAYTNAVAAALSASNAQNSVAASCILYNTNQSGFAVYHPFVLHTNNLSMTYYSDGSDPFYFVTNRFSTPMGDNLYAVTMPYGFGGTPTDITNTAAYFVLKFTQTSTVSNGDLPPLGSWPLNANSIYYFVIYR